MIEKIAYFLGRNDEASNIELALELIQTRDKEGIIEIVAGLDNKIKQVSSDCIKVLYEIGEREPSLISDHVEIFLKLLASKNNRLVWGAMTALSKIAFLKSKEIFDNLENVINAYEAGSVITVDNSISVFAELAKSNSGYEEKILPLIINHLDNCNPKQLCQHAERAFVCITKENSHSFKTVLLKRQYLLTEPQKKRLGKLIKKCP